MKTPLKKFTTTLIILAMVTGIIVSCKKSQQEDKRQDFSSIELAKGLLFLNGPVASVIPELKDASEFLSVTLRNKIGESAYRQSKQNENSAINEVLDIAQQLDPRFLNNFKTQVTSKNPETISKAMIYANKLIYTSVLYKQYGSKIGAEQNRIKFNEIFFSKGSELSPLIASINNNNLDGLAIAQKVKKLMESNNIELNLLVKSKNGTAFTNQMEANEGNCVLAIALNIGAFVNIGMIINVVALVNIEVGFNVHQAAAVTKYTAITKEFQNEASAVSGLNGELLSSSIAKTL